MINSQARCWFRKLSWKREGVITSNYVSGCAALLSRCCSAAEEELLSKHWCIKSAVSGKVSGLEKEDLEEVPEG